MMKFDVKKVKEDKPANTVAKTQFKEIVKECNLESVFQFDKNSCYVAFAAVIKKLKGYDMTEAEAESYAIMKVEPKMRKQFKKAVALYMGEHPDVVDDIIHMEDVKAKNYKATIDEFFANSTDYGADATEPNILEKIVYTPIVGIMDFVYDHF